MNDLIRRLLLLPPQASTNARAVDTLHYVVIGLTMLVAILTAVVVLYYVVRYRARGAPSRTPRLETGRVSEAAVAATVLVSFVLFWVVGYRQYAAMASPPPDATNVYVTAKQWMWKFSYADGGDAMDVLTVPVHRPTRLVMTSRDVIHSFFVPAFRLKQDVLPGRYVSAWFEASEPGEFEILCAEYCGTGHSRMLGAVRVLSADDYAAWLASRAGAARTEDLARTGREVAVRRACVACHTFDGQRHIGPTFARLYGSTVQLEAGRSVVADEAYLTRSMMEPAADVVLGFKPVMPVYQGQLDEAEVAALVELIKSLRAGEETSRIELPEVDAR